LSALRRRLPGVTQRRLTLHVRELERDGLIIREAYPELPPKVEYSLTPSSQSLEPLPRLMSAWGHANRPALVEGVTPETDDKQNKRRSVQHVAA